MANKNEYKILVLCGMLVLGLVTNSYNLAAQEVEARIAGPSQIGNQNTSLIGKNTYVEADEEAEDSFKTISQMNNLNETKYYSFEDLNTDIVKGVTDNVEINESIRPMTKSQALSLGYNQTIEFVGDDWKIDSAKQEATINSKITDSSNYLIVKNYGLYYNFNTLDYSPVDLQINVDYLDFWNTTIVNKGLTIGLNSGGISITNSDTDEIELSIKYTRSDNGQKVDVPVLYNFSDIDATASLGFKESDLKAVGAYYVDSSKSENATLGDYKHENDILTDGSKGLPTWNYESYYKYISDNYDNYDFGAYYHSGDRSDYNDTTALSSANGNLTPKERGWNRLGYAQKNGYVTIQDTWGANSNGASTSSPTRNYAMKTDGKESMVTVMANSNMSFTLNFSNALFNTPIISKGASQTITLKPFGFDGDTIIEKSVADENNDNVVQNGEKLTYTIKVNNLDPFKAVKNVPVRDSMLESIPSYASFNDDINTIGIYSDGTEYEINTSGDLTKANYILDQIKPSSQAIITYTMTINDVSKIENINNVATDNGEKPEGLCTPDTPTLDCDSTLTPVQGEPIISKKVIDESGDSVASEGEKLTYTITVKNENSTSVNNVAVRDSLLEDLPDFVKFNNDVKISPNLATSGDLTKGTYIIENIPANSSVDIVYSVTLVETPPTDVVDTIENIVTDNGEKPDICDEVDKLKDCDGTITPIEPETIIEKSVSDASGDGKVQNGEVLTYTINVTNPSNTILASNVAVRDSLLENLPNYVTYNNDVKVTPNVETSGDLTKGNFVLSQVPSSTTVKISYTLRVNAIPDDVSEVINLVTDNGEDPTTCDIDKLTDDCSGTITPTEDNRHIDPEQAETVVSKTVMDENEDGIVQNGETIHYAIKVENPSAEVSAKNVVIRDSLVENTPEWMIYNDDLVLGTKEEYSGNLKDGDLVITQVQPKEIVNITYSFTVVEYPEDVESLINIVTDNGENPEVCKAEDKLIDCDEVIIPTEPTTVVEKEVIDENEDGIVQDGETLTYTIDVRNETTLPITNVTVRDSMLENLEDYGYIDYLNNPQVEGIKFDVETSGDLIEGNFVIGKIPAKSSVQITYELKVNEVPEEVESLVNIVTDNGENPEVCVTEEKLIDCDETIIPTEPTTIVEKQIIDENEDGIVQDDETLTYTIDVRNETTLPITNITVRDSMLENLDDYEYIDYLNNPQVEGTKFEAKTSGDLIEGNFLIAKIPAKSSVQITYELKVNEVPKEVESLINIVTDNGENPEVCETDDKLIDCDEVIIPTEPTTVIEKDVVDESGDGKVQDGEVLSYKILVSNNTTLPITNTIVRDSLLENLPEYLEFNNKPSIEGTKFEVQTIGNIENGDLTIMNIPAKSSVQITYKLKVNEVPEDVTEVLNKATDNGDDPMSCKEESIDCSIATIPTEDAIEESSEVASEEELYVPETLPSTGLSEQEHLTFIEWLKNQVM